MAAKADGLSESPGYEKKPRDALLRLEGVTKSFGGVRVLNGIDLSVHTGEFVTLLGASGCGKTTTLRIIAGLEQPDSGRVWLDGRDVTGCAPNKRNVNTVFQNYALFPHMNVEANIGYSLRIKNLPKKEIRRAVSEALDTVRLSGYEKRMPHELSGGQSQRVAIARAIVNNPKALLLDEPLGALDLQLRRQMQLELKRLQKLLKIAFVYITHDQEEALNMSDHIAVMHNGAFEQVGRASDVYDRPRTGYVARFVGNANVLNGFSVDGLPKPGTSIAVRSEYIKLAPAGAAEENAMADGFLGAITAKVTDKSFTGGLLRITADFGGDAQIVASRHGIDSSLSVGQTVNVSWAAGSAVVVDCAGYTGCEGGALTTNAGRRAQSSGGKNAGGAVFDG